MKYIKERSSLTEKNVGLMVEDLLDVLGPLDLEKIKGSDPKMFSDLKNDANVVFGSICRLMMSEGVDLSKHNLKKNFHNLKSLIKSFDL